MNNQSYPFARAPRLRHFGATISSTETLDATIDRLAAVAISDPQFRGNSYGAALSRYVGGKREQLEVYDQLWPADVGNRVLIDPTMGSGSIFFHLAGRLTHGALLADVNPALINAAKVVKADIGALELALAGLVQRYNQACQEDIAAGRPAKVAQGSLAPADLASGRVYYAIRDLQRARGHHFGDHAPDAYEGLTLPDAVVMDAAIFFMLIWLSFNGLWRVNANGQHNGPHDHTKTNLNLSAKLTELRRCHDGFNAVQTDIRLIGDFSDLTDDILKLARGCKSAGGTGAFVYVDPPYAPVKKPERVEGEKRKVGAKSFTSYAKDDFGPDDQKRLRDFLVYIGGADIGDEGRSGSESLVKIMTSNSYCDETLGLYGQAPDGRVTFNITETFASRRVNRDASARGAVSEIVARNYTD